MQNEEFPTLPGEKKEEERHYKFRANSYEEALQGLLASAMKKPKAELSAQKIGIKPPSSFRQMANAQLESGVRFELMIIGNYDDPLPDDERPSNVECSVLEFPDRAKDCGDALIKTAIKMMYDANAGLCSPAFICYGGFRVSETSHNVEFSLTVFPALAPGFVLNNPATG